MKAEEKVATARGTVARGRTVYIPHPTEKVPCGTHPITFEPMFVAKNIHYEPGAEVTLPVDEINWLREAGFLVDPNKIAVGDVPVTPVDGSSGLRRGGFG